MADNKVVDVTISRAATSPSGADFGTGILVAPTVAFSDRLKYYTTADEVDADFGETNILNTALKRGLEQRTILGDRVKKIGLGRKLVDSNRVTINNVKNSTAYTTTVDGTDYVYTSDATATRDEITLGLSGLITAGFWTGTAVNTPGVTAEYDFAGAGAGDFDSVLDAHNVGAVGNSVSFALDDTLESETGIDIGGVDAGAKLFITVLKSLVPTRSAGDFALGRIHFSGAGTANPLTATLTSDGLQSSLVDGTLDTAGTYWKLTFSGALTANPTVGEKVNFGEAPTITVSGNAVAVEYAPDSTIVSDVETLITALSGTNDVLDVKTPGTGATILDSGSPFSAVLLTGGADAYYTLSKGTAYTVSVDSNQSISNLVSTETYSTALGAIRAFDDTWYGLTIQSRLDADIQAVSTYNNALADPKYFICASNSADIYNAAVTTDIASVLKGLGHSHTELIYHTYATGTSTDEYIDVAKMSDALAQDMDTQQLQDKFAFFDSVTAETDMNVEANLGITKLDSIKDKYCNVYRASRTDIYDDGRTMSGDFGEQVRGDDWFKTRVAENLYDAIATTIKQSFDDAPVIVDTAFKSVFDLGVNVRYCVVDKDMDDLGNYLSGGSPRGYYPIYPDPRSFSASERSLGDYTGVKVTIRRLNPIKSVTLNIFVVT